MCGLAAIHANTYIVLFENPLEHPALSIFLLVRQLKQLTSAAVGSSYDVAFAKRTYQLQSL